MQPIDFKVVIPARYASKRLPGKPLRMLAGKPLIQHVLERANESQAGQVVVATDDRRIRDAVERLGGICCLTRSDHCSGTDRIAEVAESFGWPEETIVVNLQGDEPCMPAGLINQVAADMASHQQASMTTLATSISERSVLFDPHVVKVVTDVRGFALYFSRAPVPWHRDEFLAEDVPLPQSVNFFRHIGLYAYRAGFLENFVSWEPAPLEIAEALEQLRVLWHGARIHVSLAKEMPGQGVDTPDDLRRVEALLSR